MKRKFYTDIADPESCEIFSVNILLSEHEEGTVLPPAKKRKLGCNKKCARIAYVRSNSHFYKSICNGLLDAIK